MPDISAKLVMTLRDRYNVPMMKSKKALIAVAEGQTADEPWIEAAYEWLRKNNEISANFAARETTNGGLGLALGSIGGQGAGALVLLGCQTDFVSGNDVFKAFVKQLADTALATGADSVDALKAAKFDSATVTEAIASKIMSIGENLAILKVAVLKGATVVGYNHVGRVATLIAGTGDAEKLRKIALHTASAPIVPLALDRAGIDPALVKKEEEILLATPEVQSKPEAMRPKIIQGKLGRFYKENTLLEQEMLLDAEKGETVSAYAKRNGLTVTGFVRLSV
jgi:elongation factor Ts